MALLLAAYPTACADPPAHVPGTAPPVRDAQALAARIDELVAQRWAAVKVEPAPRADDAEFLRRAYLDLAGRIPSVAEARTFLADTRPDKRQQLVERQLASPGYVAHFTNVWRALLLPEVSTNIQVRIALPGFQAWVRQQLAGNVGYDRMVRELLTAPVTGGGPQLAVRAGAQGEPSPAAFYLAKEVKPENLAAATSRLFLGVKLECAQCHNHPFASWKRDQFWTYAAFFAGLQARQQGNRFNPRPEDLAKRELTVPGTERVVKARFLDGSEPKWQDGVAARATLAEWMTAKDNPYFARAAANRMWAYFFGTGLVEPVDEMVGTEHAASHPELLDELAGQFAAHDFDLKFLIRAITASRAYQLTSAAAHKDQEDPTLFARMALKGLTAEQLFDSVAQATGFQESGPARNPRAAVLGGGGGAARTAFLAKFANEGEKPTETQTSVLQALTLMNGRVIADATSLERSETLAAVVDAPFLNTPRRIEALYLAALSRPPRPTELARLVKYVDGGGAGDAKAKSYDLALADVFWALLNSSEFILNH
jgi:hypothetical protein